MGILAAFSLVMFAQVIPGLVPLTGYPVPPIIDEPWIATQVGAGVCSSFIEVDGTLNMTAAGANGEGCFVHKTAPAGTIEFLSQIVSITESLTPDPVFGPAIRDDASDPNSTFFKCFWRESRVRCSYRQTPGGSVTTGIFGAEGFSLPVSIGLQRIGNDVHVWESDIEDPDALDDWSRIAIIPMPGSFLGDVEVGQMLVSGHVSNTASMVTDNGTITSSLTLVDQPDDARNVHYLRDFETGAFQAIGSLHDGGRILTLPDPQTTTEPCVHDSGLTCGEAYAFAQGGCGAESDCQSKVVESCDVIENNTENTPTGETILPRDGDFFLCAKNYQSTHKNASNLRVVKPITELPGDVELDYDRRDYRNLSNGSNRQEFGNQEQLVEFDVEVWWGGSYYFPLNWEVERGSPHQSASDRLLSEQGVQPSNDMWGAHVFSVPCCDGTSESWLHIDYETGTSRINQPLHEIILGQWNDVVVRFRANPCAGPSFCNYPGVGTLLPNQGILQVWARDPADTTPDVDGCYDMIQYIDRVNQTMGPNPDPDLINVRDKLYTFGWGNNPTSVFGPIMVGFDEISWGFAGDGTTYEDVHPRRCAQP